MGSQVPLGDAQIAQLMASLPAANRLQMHNDNMIRAAEAGAAARNPAPPAGGGGISGLLMGLLNRFTGSGNQAPAQAVAPAPDPLAQAALEEEKRRKLLEALGGGGQ